jgi:hypothetical protein
VIGSIATGVLAYRDGWRFCSSTTHWSASHAACCGGP